MRVLARVAAAGLLFIVVVAGTFGQSQTIRVTMSASGDVHKFKPGGSKHAIPAKILKEYESTNRAAPAIAVKPGDKLVFVNAGNVYYKPFSFSLGNRFEFGRKGIAPGGSQSYVVKNATGKPLVLSIRDEMHNRLNPLLIIVLPEKEAKEVEKATYTGTWKTTFGTMVLTQSGPAVSGTYDYKGGSTVDGAIGEDGVFHFTWKEPAVNGTPGRHGVGTFTLSSDGKSFTGTWNYILSDGKTKGNGGGWSGTRLK